MTLLIVCALAVILNGQEEYVPQVQAAQMNVERSQVYLDGKGYKLDNSRRKSISSRKSSGKKNSSKSRKHRRIRKLHQSGSVPAA